MKELARRILNQKMYYSREDRYYDKLPWLSIAEIIKKTYPELAQVLINEIKESHIRLISLPPGEARYYYLSIHDESNDPLFNQPGFTTNIVSLNKKNCIYYTTVYFTPGIPPSSEDLLTQSGIRQHLIYQMLTATDEANLPEEDVIENCIEEVVWNIYGNIKIRDERNRCLIEERYWEYGDPIELIMKGG